MKWLWFAAKFTVCAALLVGLVFSSGVFSVLIYAKMTGKEWAFSYSKMTSAKTGEALASVEPIKPPQVSEPLEPISNKASALLEAPVIRQFPELPSGCEVVSLTMLLQYSGINKGKMELATEMKRDPTPMTQRPDGTIVHWGNPNTGFVGDITGKSRAFGIYHGALLDLLVRYIPAGEDLTGKPFERLERQISGDVPVVVWTTIDFEEPEEWVVWDTPIGPLQTTFMEHAVLLVGYDADSVYVNDPRTGKSKVKIEKTQFVKSWEAMGRQAISYRKGSK